MGPVLFDPSVGPVLGDTIGVFDMSGINRAGSIHVSGFSRFLPRFPALSQPGVIFHLPF